MILEDYGRIYTEEEIMAKRLSFSAAMLNFIPITLISSVNSPKSKPIKLSDFTEEQLEEIEKYLATYTEKPYVVEAKGNIYVIISSFYPNSTSCLVLRIDMAPNVFLRLVKEKQGFFVLSKGITTIPARMSKRLDSDRVKFFELCSEIESAFMHMERFSLYFDDREVFEGYSEQIFALSRFFAVPVRRVLTESNDDGIAIKSNFALFTSFCSTMMMLARNEAVDRAISAELNFFGGTLTVKLSFKTDGALKVTNETLLWQCIAADKRMAFDFYDRDGRFYIEFQPHYIDWSYFGLKQKSDVELDFEE